MTVYEVSLLTNHMVDEFFHIGFHPKTNLEDIWVVQFRLRHPRYTPGEHQSMIFEIGSPSPFMGDTPELFGMSITPEELVRYSDNRNAVYGQQSLREGIAALVQHVYV